MWEQNENEYIFVMNSSQAGGLLVVAVNPVGLLLSSFT